MPHPRTTRVLAAVLGACALSPLAAFASLPQIGAPADDSQRVVLAHITRAEANAQNDRGRVPDTMRLDGLQLLLHRGAKEQAALDRLSRDLHDPHSPRYRKWLTAKQFADRYGVAKSDIDAVSAWLTHHGLHVDGVSGNRMAINFSGTAGQLRDAFQTEIHRLSVKGAPHLANMSDPRIPAALKPAVVGITALNDFRPHPNMIKRGDFTIKGTTGGKSYALAPEDLATIYNITPVFSSGVAGQGQTVVVIEDSNVVNTADFDTFRTTFGLSSYTTGSFTQVHPAGSTKCRNPLVNEAESEAILDAEWASAAAPAAAIVLSSCRDTLSDFGGFIALQNMLESASPPAIVSISYGQCEVELGEATNVYINGLYQQADAEGTSVFVSSGDESSAECDDRNNVATHGVSVSGFMSTPYNVSVGGTDFIDTARGANRKYWNPTNDAVYGSAKSYIPEMPWADSCANMILSQHEGYATPYGSDGFCNSAAGADDLSTVGGSGGPSGCATGTPSEDNQVSGTCAGYAKPAWQVLAGVPKDGVRDTPDVSLMSANGLWGHYYVFCDTAGGCAGTPDHWSGAGGTSFASPILAGIQALVNQHTGSAQGNPNPVYYSLAAADYGRKGNPACYSGQHIAGTCVFNDVVQGDNDVNCTGTVNCYTPSGTNGVLSTDDANYAPAFKTRKGYDFPTGIGSVNVANLVNSWPQ
ncbi:MAG TPA: S53 family peptidase [Rhizomicrobium sp.]|nr:S53 family peptidase [Rhizomicrobium sp.]